MLISWSWKLQRDCCCILTRLCPFNVASTKGYGITAYSILVERCQIVSPKPIYSTQTSMLRTVYSGYSSSCCSGLKRTQMSVNGAHTNVRISRRLQQRPAGSSPGWRFACSAVSQFDRPDIARQSQTCSR